MQDTSASSGPSAERSTLVTSLVTGVASWAADAKTALRRARRHPGPLALMTLIVAAATAGLLVVVALVDSVLLRPLPYPEAERLVRLWETQEGDARVGPAKGNLADWRRSEAFDGIAGWYVAPRTFLSGDVLEVVETAQVSTDFFPLLGVEPVRGRTFTAQETDLATYNTANAFDGSEPVAVISHRLWRRLGSTDDILSREVSIDRRLWKVIGVLPADFAYPNADIDLWIPWSLVGELPRDQRYLEAIGRLAAGVTPTQAATDLGRIADDLGRRYPDTNAGWGVAIETLHAAVVGQARPYLLLAALGIGSLALLASLHLVSLQWVHMASRIRELRVRRALGAPEGSLHRCLLVEAQIPVVLGFVVGWPLAHLALVGLRHWQLMDLPRLAELALRPETLLWTLFGAAMVAGLSGWIPALAHGRAAVSGGFSGRDQRFVAAHSPSGWWAASEVALTLAVLMVAT